MKNQNDMIFSIVAIVLMLIAGIALYATMPEPPPAVSVEAISTQLTGPPAGNVVKAANLPGGSNNAGGGAGGGARMGGGGGGLTPAAPPGAGAGGGGGLTPATPPGAGAGAG